MSVISAEDIFDCSISWKSVTMEEFSGQREGSLLPAKQNIAALIDIKNENMFVGRQEKKRNVQTLTFFEFKFK